MDSSCSRTAERRGPPEGTGDGGGSRRGDDGRDGERRRGRLFSPASSAEHARVTRRLLWALPAALALIAVLALFGPTAEEIERKFTIYGKEGPLRIMPEVAVDDGLDPVEQRPRPQAAPPPGATDFEVLPEDPLSVETTPPPRQGEAAAPAVDRSQDPELPVDRVTIGAGDGEADVEMLLPSQFADSDYIIRKLVRPLYPVRASAADRLRPLIVVEAGIYLDEEANIVGVVIERNDGGPEFAEVVLNAMRQWELEPRWRDGKPPAPRWLRVPWRFRSPLGN
jgi:hypothetical protein